VAIRLKAIVEAAEVERIFPVVVLYMLIGGEVQKRDDSVIEGQQKYRNQHNQAVEHEQDKKRRFPDSRHPIIHVIVAAILLDCQLVENVEGLIYGKKEEHRRTEDQGDKETVVVQPNAIAKPSAMVVEAKNTIVTKRAMLRAWRPKYHASRAPLLLHTDTIDAQKARTWHTAKIPVIFEAFRNAFLPWNDSWVRECGQGKRNDDHDANYALRDAN